MTKFRALKSEVHSYFECPGDDTAGTEEVLLIQSAQPIVYYAQAVVIPEYAKWLH